QIILSSLDEPDGLAPRGLNLLRRRLREFVRLDRQFFLQFAVAQNFDRVVLPLDDAGSLERRRIDRGAVLEALFEGRHIDNCHDSGEIFVVEPALGQAPHERHLPPFEGKASRESGMCRMPLVAPASCLAVTRPRAATDALTVLALYDPAMNVVDQHFRSSPR